MNIPDEVFRDAFGAAVLKMPHEGYLRYASQVIAEWARKEALREAAQAALSTPLTLNDIGYEAEEIADAIRALAERRSLMDSSNAEKATEARSELFAGAPQDARAFIAADKAGFRAGHASWDAEVAELTRLLAEARARYGDLEVQLAEAQAVIEKVREAHGERFADTGRITTWADARMGVALKSAPSVVLQDRDREVAAWTLEAIADEGERFMFGATGERMPVDMDAEGIQPRWHEIRRLRERAAAIRKGDKQ